MLSSFFYYIPNRIIHLDSLIPYEIASFEENYIVLNILAFKEISDLVG